MSKIFDTFIDLLTLNSTVTQLEKDIRQTNNELRKIEKRLIRIETFFELMALQKKSLSID